MIESLLFFPTVSQQHDSGRQPAFPFLLGAVGVADLNTNVYCGVSSSTLRDTLFVIRTMDLLSPGWSSSSFRDVSPNTAQTLRADDESTKQQRDCDATAEA